MNRADHIRRLEEIERRFDGGSHFLSVDDIEFLLYHTRRSVTGLAEPEQPSTPGSYRNARGCLDLGGERSEDIIRRGRGK